MERRRYLRTLGVGATLSVAGCVDAPPVASSESPDRLTVAAGTTTADSGLLDRITPAFEERFGTRVDAVIRGTGGALRTARDGDCDLVLVHARPLEDRFLETGAGVNRRAVMVNDFLLVGPPEDPAGVTGHDPVSAFQAIAAASTPFFSRGDESGTHVRERTIWAEAGVDPGGEWYSETGQGMGQTLAMAARTPGYTLTDRGSFLNAATDGSLVAHVDQGIDAPPSLLRNEYAAIPVNPARHDVAYTLAMAYVGYLTGPGRARIGSFSIDGQRAFRPIAYGDRPSFRQYVPRDWEGESFE
ncbi:MAG: substrate-binding domain-containing protein [Halorubrum sp.]